MIIDSRFTRVPSGRFGVRYGPLGRAASHSQKKLCLVATDPAFLIELLYGLSLRADCRAVKYGAVAREGMYLGRCFLATDEAAGKLCEELKAHPRVMVSLQDDAWYESFRSHHGAADSSVWDAWPEHEPEVAAVITSAFGRDDEPRLVRALCATPTPATQVTLETAGPADGELLANLLELYIHDLSAIFARVELGADGRFGYPPLAAYLSGRTDRFAFLLRWDGQLAGFALAQRGSPVADDPNVLDVAEFFVLRRFRARGVGRAAAALLWDRLPGTWTIRAAVENAPAVPFWRGAVAAYTRGAGTEREHLVGSSKWIVFSLDSAARDR